MAETYIAKDGDMVEEICWRYYKPPFLPMTNERLSFVLYRVLDANPGLADLGVRLPAGTAVYLPDLPNPETVPIVKIWG